MPWTREKKLPSGWLGFRSTTQKTVGWRDELLKGRKTSARHGRTRRASGRRRDPTQRSADVPCAIGWTGEATDGTNPPQTKRRREETIDAFVARTHLPGRLQYLINVPEGLSRLCLEHKIRPTGKLKAVFCTDTQQDQVGGMAGLLLRLSQDGHGQLEAVGTNGFGKYLHALRHFVRWLHPKVAVMECEHLQPGEVLYEDDTIAALHYAHQQPVASDRKRHRIECMDMIDTAAKSRASLQPMAMAPECLPVARSDLQGRIDAFFAQQQRDDTQFREGTHFGRNQVLDDKDWNLVPFSDEMGSLFCKQADKKRMAASTSGPTNTSDLICYNLRWKSLNTSVLFVDCRDVESLSAFENDQNLSALQSGERACCMVFHFTKYTICTSTQYQKVFQQFPSQVHQVYLDKGPTSGTLGHHSALRTTWKLNMISKIHFPLPFRGGDGEDEPQSWNLESLRKYTIKPVEGSTQPLVQVEAANFHEMDDMSTLQIALFEEKPELEQQLRQVRTKLETIIPIARDGASTNKSAAEKLREKLKRGACTAATAPTSRDKPQAVAQQGPSIFFLGTGCAEPSKYRASSGILVRMGFGRGLLMDAGEGTWGQMVRFFGSSMAERIVNDLEVIWISHKHADHMLGILSIVKHRTASTPFYVVCPGQVLSWLKEVMPIQGSSCRLIHCEHFGRSKSSAQWEAIGRLGLKEWSSFRVIHCEQSYGLSIRHADGWKLVYSGDTRPCRNLQEAARGATVLIHEATFEEELKSHALRKKHCTWREALEAGRICNVRTLILTHFSQRYPKMPALEGPLDILNRTLVAFDGLHLPLSDLAHAPSLMQGIRWLFPATNSSNGEELVP